MSNPLPYWNETITIVNKLSAKDSVTKTDIWVKTILSNCFYRQTTVRNISETDVNIGTASICRIPKNPNYKAYSEWREDITNGFTLRAGDYIFKGEIAEEITADNIISVYNSHKPDVMLVKSVSDNSNFLGLGEHYKAEGV